MKLSRLGAIGFAGVGLILLLGLLPVEAHSAEPNAPVFRAGASGLDITPPLGCSIVGNFEVPKATYIHDPLYVRSIVLDDGTRRLAIVVCDNLGIDRPVYDQAKARLQEKTGIPPENMFMASIHTHSGPPARTGNVLKPNKDLSDYQEFLRDRIVDSVICAVANLEPAQIGWGRAEEPSQVFNRRWYMSDPAMMVSPFGVQDKVRMNPPCAHPAQVKPAGPTDPEVKFLSVRSVDGRPIAFLANYSLHYVGGVGPGHISADYYGVFCDRIQQLLGADRLTPPFVGIMSNGTSGDVNNIDFYHPRPKREPYEQMRAVANMVADKVYAAYQATDYRTDVKLGARMTKLTLGVRKPDEATVEWAKAILAKPKEETDLIKRSYAERTMMQKDSPDTVDVWIQALRIGEVGIAGVPFETFAETGLRIKKDSPLPVTFTISQANGGYGYLPTPAQHELGGYETWLGTSRVVPDSEPKIVDTLFAQLGDLAKE